jgi:hypothetical protein
MASVLGSIDFLPFAKEIIEFETKNSPSNKFFIFLVLGFVAKLNNFCIIKFFFFSILKKNDKINIHHIGTLSIYIHEYFSSKEHSTKGNNQ